MRKLPNCPESDTTEERNALFEERNQTTQEGEEIYNEFVATHSKALADKIFEQLFSPNFRDNIQMEAVLRSRSVVADSLFNNAYAALRTLNSRRDDPMLPRQRGTSSDGSSDYCLLDKKATRCVDLCLPAREASGLVWIDQPKLWGALPTQNVLAFVALKRAAL